MHYKGLQANSTACRDVAFAKMALDVPRGMVLSYAQSTLGWRRRVYSSRGICVSEEKTKAEGPVVIKKYANRRLYNTQTSSYVTLDHLAAMVKEGTEFEVQDARTGEDITRSVLTQIIFEEEAKGQNPAADQVPAPADPLLWRQSAGLRARLSGHEHGQLHQEPGRHARPHRRSAGRRQPDGRESDAAESAMFERAMEMFTPFGAAARAARPKNRPRKNRPPAMSTP